MAWETRKGKRYYYLKVRKGTKVKSVYLGTGVVAQAMDTLAAYRVRWMELRKEAIALDVDPWYIDVGDALFTNRKREKRNL